MQILVVVSIHILLCQLTYVLSILHFDSPKGLLWKRSSAALQVKLKTLCLSFRPVTVEVKRRQVLCRSAQGAPGVRLHVQGWNLCVALPLVLS